MGEAPTVRKLGRISDGAKASYFLAPPKHWLQATEKAAGKKILYFALKSEDESLILTPVFSEPRVEQPKNSSPDVVQQMLETGTLLAKLRDVCKGENVYRTMNLPRSWVRTMEQSRWRKMAALRTTAKQGFLLVEPVFGEKLRQS